MAVESRARTGRVEQVGYQLVGYVYYVGVGEGEG